MCGGFFSFPVFFILFFKMIQFCRVVREILFAPEMSCVWVLARPRGKQFGADREGGVRSRTLSLAYLRQRMRKVANDPLLKGIVTGWEEEGAFQASLQAKEEK